MNLRKIIYGALSLFISVCTVFAFQNCGGVYGDPNLTSDSDPNLVFEKFSTSTAVLPDAAPPVFEAKGCLRAVDLMRFDSRWASLREDGSVRLDWDVIATIPHEETHHRFEVNKAITFLPDGTPIGDFELPEGRFARVDLIFRRGNCGDEFQDIHFEVSNANGTFMSGPDHIDSSLPDRNTRFFFQHDFTVDEDVVGMRIDVQLLIDYLETVSQNGDVYAGHQIGGLVNLIYSEPDSN